jgi:hypothetical protein
MTGDTSTNVVLKVAEKLGTDPLELPRLSEQVEPDALDKLHDSDAAVCFEYCGYTVHICPENVITLTKNHA